MIAGQPKSGDWAKPAPGKKMGFDKDSVGTRFRLGSSFRWASGINLNQVLSIIFLLLSSVAASEAAAQSQSELAVGKLRMNRAVFGVFEGTGREPSMLVHLDKGYTDYEIKGFYRIGSLPIGVAEGVTFELRHVDALTNRLAQVQRWLGSQGRSRLELRRVTFLVSATVTNRLESVRARVSQDGKLELLEGVAFLSGTNEMRSFRGTLQITGQKAGQVVLETSPPWTNNLFAHLQPVDLSNQKLP